MVYVPEAFLVYHKHKGTNKKQCSQIKWVTGFTTVHIWSSDGDKQQQYGRFPEILPAFSSRGKKKKTENLLPAPAVVEALNWDENTRKAGGEATERDAERGEEEDTVGDREWQQGRKLKRGN